jgi:predicted aspartyl protease
MRLGFLLFAFLAAATVAYADTVTVPFVRTNGILWVRVGLGSRSVDCAIDTGAAVTQFTSETIRASGIPWHPTQSPLFTNATGVRYPMRMGSLALRLGDARIDNVQAVEQPNRQADCLLGQSMFSAFQFVTLDLTNNVLFLVTESRK